MLREYPPTRQISGEPRRRWFRSLDCDLIVWLADDGSLSGFQFCYDKDTQEHALSWKKEVGFSHMRVDGGSSVAANRSPILVADGSFDPGYILDVFRAESSELPPGYAEFVAGKLGMLAQR